MKEAASRYAIGIEYVPVVPPPDAMAEVLSDESRLAYLVEDVGRFAAAYGLSFRPPDALDVNWQKAHAAYLGAAEQGRGPAYAEAAYTARFCHNQSVADDSVIAELSLACGLEPAAILAAATDRGVHRRLLRAAAAARKARIFGVPFFVWGERRYWGNDRVEWLLRDLAASRGEPVPDLSSDRLAHPVAARDSLPRG